MSTMYSVSTTFSSSRRAACDSQSRSTSSRDGASIPSRQAACANRQARSAPTCVLPTSPSNWHRHALARRLAREDAVALEGLVALREELLELLAPHALGLARREALLEAPAKRLVALVEGVEGAGTGRKRLAQPRREVRARRPHRVGVRGLGARRGADRGLRDRAEHLVERVGARRLGEDGGSRHRQLRVGAEEPPRRHVRQHARAAEAVAPEHDGDRRAGHAGGERLAEEAAERAQRLEPLGDARARRVEVEDERRLLARGDGEERHELRHLRLADGAARDAVLDERHAQRLSVELALAEREVARRCAQRLRSRRRRAAPRAASGARDGAHGARRPRAPRRDARPRARRRGRSGGGNSSRPRRRRCRAARGADGRQERRLPHRHRHVVVLVAERAGHAAAARLDGASRGQPGTARRAASVSSKAPKAFWWQWPCTRNSGGRTLAPRDGGALLHGSLAMKLSKVTASSARAVGARVARVHREELVLERVQARGLEPDDRDAALDPGRERLDHPPRLGLRAVDHAGRKVGAPAAQRPASPRRARGRPRSPPPRITRARGVEVAGLEPVVEGVGEEHRLAPSARRVRAAGPRARSGR